MIEKARFRLSRATFGVRLEDGKVVEAVEIPRDSVVAIVNGIEDAHRMIEVEWNGRHVKVFPQDLRNRGEMVGRFDAA